MFFSYLYRNGGVVKPLASYQCMWPGFDSSPVPYMGCVCCWFFPCFKVFFFRVLRLFSQPNSNSIRFEGAGENQPEVNEVSLLNIIICMMAGDKLKETSHKYS